ncbi:SAM-dependent methyltransferase [Nonomuraea sediminis]|uniref:SAM-dependent methyltransferase n=1 Tax=Nonomuraea sediminis TaxID=2835864 RepID=UPI001BDC8438|nr:SAM-dependent methyltransferase [Nonomuraea sediminis]
MSEEWAPKGVDPTVPNPARVYDYLLGGKDNFKADRDVAEGVLRVLPETRQATRMYRRMVGRFVEYLVGQGVRQFLDLGSGLPTHQNVHEVAPPDARVVYVDNDPVVCTHGRALLAEPDRVVMVEADARDVDGILIEARKHLDLEQPVAVLMLFLLHFVPDEQDPYAMVAAYRDALVPGSYLVISHTAGDTDPERMGRLVDNYRQTGTPFRPRSAAEIMPFFGDFELIPPGLANGVTHEWPFGDEQDTMFWDEKWSKLSYSGIARKP